MPWPPPTPSAGSFPRRSSGRKRLSIGRSRNRKRTCSAHAWSFTNRSSRTAWERGPGRGIPMATCGSPLKGKENKEKQRMVRKALVFLVCGWICTNFMGVGLAHEPPQPAGQSGQGPSWLMGTYQSLVPPCYQGLIATVFGQDDAALACLAEAIQRDPHNSAVYLLRAWVYQDKVYLNQALADCTKALQLDPNQAVAYGFRGLAHCKKGDLDHAIADFTEALRLNPNHPGNLVYRGLCYSAKRDFDKAIQDFTAALQLNPLAARVHALRAAVYFAKQDLARAVDDLKAAHEIEPGNAEYLNVIDSFYLCTGRSQEAITAFTAAIDVDPKYAPAFVGRACIRMELGEYAGAIADNSQA